MPDYLSNRDFPENIDDFTKDEAKDFLMELWRMSEEHWIQLTEMPYPPLVLVDLIKKSELRPIPDSIPPTTAEITLFATCVLPPGLRALQIASQIATEPDLEKLFNTIALPLAAQREKRADEARLLVDPLRHSTDDLAHPDPKKRPN